MVLEKIGNKFSQFFAMDPDEDDLTSAPAETAAPASPAPQAKLAAKPNYRTNKVVAMGEPTEKTAKIVVYEPRIYSDAKEIGNHLMNNRAVVVNFDQIESADATRIVDFLTGTVFAIHGEIKRIGQMIFLVTPANFQIDGSLAATLGTDDDIDLG